MNLGPLFLVIVLLHGVLCVICVLYALYVFVVVTIHVAVPGMCYLLQNVRNARCHMLLAETTCDVRATTATVRCTGTWYVVLAATVLAVCARCNCIVLVYVLAAKYALYVHFAAACM